MASETPMCECGHDAKAHLDFVATADCLQCDCKTFRVVASPPASAGREEERETVEVGEMRWVVADDGYWEPAEGPGEYSDADVSALVSELRSSRSESSRLREALEDAIAAATSGSKGSVGVYCPQIYVTRVNRWHAALSPQPKEGA